MNKDYLVMNRDRDNERDYSLLAPSLSLLGQPQSGLG